MFFSDCGDLPNLVLWCFRYEYKLITMFKICKTLVYCVDIRDCINEHLVTLHKTREHWMPTIIAVLLQPLGWHNSYCNKVLNYYQLHEDTTVFLMTAKQIKQTSIIDIIWWTKLFYEKVLDVHVVFQDLRARHSPYNRKKDREKSEEL